MLYNSLLMKVLAPVMLVCALSLPGLAWQSNASAPRSTEPQQTVKVSELPPVDVSKDWSDYGYWGFTLFLTIVGGFQVYLMWGNLRVVERQADQMERQTGILQQSITLAEKSADTARQNLELFINRERAHLRIEIVPLEFPLTPGPLKVSYKLTLHGTSDAYVTNSCARVEVTNSNEPGDDAQWFPAMNIPQVITPERRVIEAQVTGVFPKELAPGDVEAIDAGRKFIHFRGFVNYKDVFGTERFTRVRRVWEMSPVRNPDGTRSGRWSRRGGAKDNSET